MRPSEAMRINRVAIRQVVAAHRASNVRVFGSVALGEDTTDSDLDLLIDPSSNTTLMDIGAIRHELKAFIGIEKGKAFNPDARTQAILELAIKDAYDYMQDMFVRNAFSNYIEGTQWSNFNLSPEQAKAGWPFVTEDRMLIDERTNLYHYATFMPKALGGGSFYLTSLFDSEGNLFDGESTYKMNVPADTPAGDFWSAIAYSFATHGFIVGSERVGISSLDKDSLQVNADGSVDLYFAPSAPEGQESNWIPTREAFWIVLRLYGPQEPLFDKFWSLPDVEKIK